MRTLNFRWNRQKFGLPRSASQSMRLPGICWNTYSTVFEFLLGLLSGCATWVIYTVLESWTLWLYDMNSHNFFKPSRDIAKLGLIPLFANLCKLVGYAKSKGSQTSIVIHPLPASPAHSIIWDYLPKVVLILRASIVMGLSWSLTLTGWLHCWVLQFNRRRTATFAMAVQDSMIYF